MQKESFSFRKRIRSFAYAFNGLKILFSTQHNARIHGFCAIIAIVLGLYFSISNIEWIAITISIGMVIAAEAFNSSIETLCNAISPEYNHQIKAIKDLAAGAVLVVAIMALTIGLLIFIPKLITTLITLQ